MLLYFSLEVSINRWTAIQMLWLKRNKSRFNKLNIICLTNSRSLPDCPGKVPCSPGLSPALYEEPDELSGLERGSYATLMNWLCPAVEQGCSLDWQVR